MCVRIKHKGPFAKVFSRVTMNAIALELNLYQRAFAIGPCGVLMEPYCRLEFQPLFARRKRPEKTPHVLVTQHIAKPNSHRNFSDTENRHAGVYLVPPPNRHLRNHLRRFAYVWLTLGVLWNEGADGAGWSAE